MTETAHAEDNSYRKMHQKHNKQDSQRSANLNTVISA